LSYLNRYAFVHYFRALIHKNWGDLSEAQHEIEQSAKLLKDQAGEFLTPVTKAEILSYNIGDEERCRAELQRLMQRIDDLEAGLKLKGESLNANQVRLRTRMLILWGNTFFVQNAFREAQAQYAKAIGFSPNNYYALASAAQCDRAMADEAATAEHFRQSLEAIEHSGDLRRKRERITRAVIAVIGANAAKACGDNARRELFEREARELLSGNLAVDGMSPKFFSPSTKRLVSATELLKDLES
jgi:tetratricopeptide (TPR) repeat protein